MAATGLDVLRSAAGCRDVQLRRGVESSSTYLLTVEWDAWAKPATHGTESS